LNIMSRLVLARTRAI